MASSGGFEHHYNLLIMKMLTCDWLNRDKHELVSLKFRTPNFWDGVCLGPTNHKPTLEQMGGAYYTDISIIWVLKN